MNVKSNNTKKEALEIAKTYLQTLGFNGFSFQTIADRLGIRKASLHYYFSSKDDMGLELLKDYETAHKEWTQKVKALSGKQKLEKMTNIFIKMIEKDQMICPIGVLSSDYNTLSVKMKKKLKDFHHVQREWLITTLEQSKKEKTLRKNLDIDATADLIMSTLQGGVQIARIKGEKESFKKMLTSLLGSLHE